ncbi:MULTISPECIES: hypothetical protein [unclassified Ruegeria]|uniref:hypothetical protein n=1 Tax=unclassified Ruegeria TaxID=2625375 RepID=UPI0014876481|nr:MULTISPECIES: hypothetical protein [unclassified Ruegeria]NOD62188.1 hypothetical protein [Ruegeria sp. HKCCD6109]NOD96997.1 hypothetical protein [Ruegeria sp. HKCCD6228]
MALFKKKPTRPDYVFVVTGREYGEDGTVHHWVAQVTDNEKAAIESGRQVACIIADTKVVDMRQNPEWPETVAVFLHNGKHYSFVDKKPLQDWPINGWDWVWERTD